MHVGARAVVLSMSVVAGAFFLTGCATPIEIKNASWAQLELIGSLDAAVVDLQRAVSEFHAAKEARILEEGRILVTRQAIAAAIPEAKIKEPVAADILFSEYSKDIQRWIDYAFQVSRIDELIKKHEREAASEQDPIKKNIIALDLQDLKELRSRLNGKPDAVVRMEANVERDIRGEQMTKEQARRFLDILRAQLAIMKGAATQVDSWLAIDVTVNQEQADNLRKSLSDGIRALEGGPR